MVILVKNRRCKFSSCLHVKRLYCQFAVRKAQAKITTMGVAPIHTVRTVLDCMTSQASGHKNDNAAQNIADKKRILTFLDKRKAEMQKDGSWENDASKVTILQQRGYSEYEAVLIVTMDRATKRALADCSKLQPAIKK